MITYTNIVLKIEMIVPYHGANQNTRNGARLRSPSPTMAPGQKVFFFFITLVKKLNLYDFFLYFL